jgi:2-octaprenyl-6-methoxyphenol hydroxylase
MLIGEAAHVFPPIGAQGLNLGIRDIKDVIDVVSKHRDDPGSPDAMQAFDRKRRADVMMRSLGVHLLNGSLLSDALPTQLARSVGLSSLRAISPLRTYVMREGLSPGSGLTGIFSDLRKKIRR